MIVTDNNYTNKDINSINNNNINDRWLIYNHFRDNKTIVVNDIDYNCNQNDKSNNERNNKRNNKDGAKIKMYGSSPVMLAYSLLIFICLSVNVKIKRILSLILIV